MVYVVVSPGLYNEGHLKGWRRQVTTVHGAHLEGAGVTAPAVAEGSWLGPCGTARDPHHHSVARDLGGRGVHPRAITAAQLKAVGRAQL